jgi:hypothetical protein
MEKTAFKGKEMVLMNVARILWFRLKCLFGKHQYESFWVQDLPGEFYTTSYAVCQSCGHVLKTKEIEGEMKVIEKI